MTQTCWSSSRATTNCTWWVPCVRGTTAPAAAAYIAAAQQLLMDLALQGDVRDRSISLLPLLLRSTRLAMARLWQSARPW